MSTTSTRDLILDTAERLFAEQGFDATSLRHLTQEAGVNLAAVNYHFGTKDGLVAAVFARHITPINAERLARIAALEARFGIANIPLEALLEAFFEPVLRLVLQPRGSSVLRLLGRLHSEPAEATSRDLFFEQFQAMRDRLVPVLAAALPRLPQRELFWRTHFMIGSMAHVLACDHGLRALSHGECDASDPDEALRQIVAFAAAGLRAPVPEPAASQPERSGVQEP